MSSRPNTIGFFSIERDEAPYNWSQPIVHEGDWCGEWSERKRKDFDQGIVSKITDIDNREEEMQGNEQ